MQYKSSEIALVHDHLNQFGGAERVLKVLADMWEDAPIYTSVFHHSLQNVFENKKIYTSFLQSLTLKGKFIKPYLPLVKTAFENFDFKPYRLIISSSSGLAKCVIPPPGSLHICYCHTPTRYLWSDTKEYLDGHRMPHIFRRCLEMYLSSLRSADFAAAQRVDLFLANSRTVAERIKTYYRRDSIVVYPPVDTDRFSSFVPLKDLGSYWIIVSRLQAYKKVDMAIQAFNRLKIPLYVIGSGPEEHRLKKMARSHIKFFGKVNDEFRDTLLQNARGLIHPQADEDFGITLVESLAAGRPVIAYKSGGPTETLIPGITGEFFTEHSWEALADAVIRFDYTKYNPYDCQMRAHSFSRTAFVTRMHYVISTLRGN